MKMVKSLLLGSAAGVVAVVGAQAADLPVKAKPVEYVKICSLYGDGFFYVPGTETCVRIGASAQADYYWNALGNGHPHYNATDSQQDRSTSSYNTRNRADIGLDSRTQTAYGTLRSVVVVRTDNTDQNTLATNVTRAYIQWAGFTFGRLRSYTDPVAGQGGGADFRNLTQGQIHSDSQANGTAQISYTWELGNGMVLIVGADERRSGSLTNLSTANQVTVGANPTTSRAGLTYPNPWVAWRGSQAWGTWSSAVILNSQRALYYTATVPAAPCAPAGVQTVTGSTLCGFPDDKFGWAILNGIEIKTPFISPGDRFGMFLNYGVGAVQYSAGNNNASPSLFQKNNQVSLGWKTDGVYINGGQIQLTTGWAVHGAYEHYWMPNLSTTGYLGRAAIEYGNTVVNSRVFCGGGGGGAQRFTVAANVVCDPSYNLWQTGIHTDWYPIPGFRLGAEVGYTFVETAFKGQTVNLTQTLGFRPTGAYTAKDQGIVNISMRAQRGFGGVGE